MFKALIAGQIANVERQFGYDASYMGFMLQAAPTSFAKFGILTQLVDRKAAPAEALAAAGLAGTLVEDCGPCTQISVDIAAAAGVTPQILRAILAGDEVEMGPAAALAWRFARASLARDMAACDPLRDEIVRVWGGRGLVAIALSLTKARMYPTVKYALGFGKTCSQIVVAGELTSVSQTLRAA